MQRFTALLQATRENPLFIFGTFFVTVFITYTVLYIVDFYPEPVADEATVETTSDTDSSPDTTEAAGEAEAAAPAPQTEVIIDDATVAPLPTMVSIPALDKTITVLNPTSRDITVLDDALLSGVVRHPDSADFSEPGNVFILGHSSYLPNVMNRNFQAFNGIQNLHWGDEIILTSDTHEYVYRVKKVYQAKASEVVVPFTPGEARLTLATCDSFASKDDRFIVEAELLEDRTTKV